MTESFRIGAVTIGPAGPDPGPLLAEAEAAVRRAAAAGAALVVLPELFARPYVAGDDPARWRGLAEAPDGPTARWAGGLARRLGIHLVFGMALAEARAKPANAALMARPDGGVEPVERKIHLPPAAPGEAFGEADHFAAGAAGIATVAIGPIRLAVLVCYDRRFPECWRAAAAAGADLVAVPVAGPAPDDPPGFHLGELATHARANAVYAVAAARTGTETVLGHPVRHDGATAAIDPNGALVACAPEEPGGLLVFDLEPARIAAARATGPTAARLRLVAPYRQQEKHNG